jgi:hypothetical protein
MSFFHIPSRRSGEKRAKKGRTNACREVEIGEVGVSSTSRRDDGEAGGYLLSMGIVYYGYFIILYVIFKVY